MTQIELRRTTCKDRAAEAYLAHDPLHIGGRHWVSCTACGEMWESGDAPWGDTTVIPQTTIIRTESGSVYVLDHEARVVTRVGEWTPTLAMIEVHNLVNWSIVGGYLTLIVHDPIRDKRGTITSTKVTSVHGS